MATTDFCDGDYLGSYRRFLEHFVANVCQDDQLPVKMSGRDIKECEVSGEIADIVLQHLNQKICPPSLQAYLVKLVTNEFRILFQKQPEDCGYRSQDKCFSPLKFMRIVTAKTNEICQRYMDNSRLALLPPPPSTPLPLASSHGIRNKRRKMEDRSVVLHDLHTMFNVKNDSVVNYYAVFDGHGGQEAAVYCAAHLHQYLVESPYYPVDPELALRDAFQTTDYRFTESDDSRISGATAVCALLYDKTLYIAWAGDSQAALIKNGQGINLTNPHKPQRPDEKSRIEALGGEIIFYGVWRINGIINVSRSLGDVKHKPFVSEEPEIKKIELDGSEDFLIIACDGFWEQATEEIAASLLYEYVASSRGCDATSASEALVKWAKQNLSYDNISVIVVFLTPPADIAAKNYWPARCTNRNKQTSSTTATEMEPMYQEADFGFPKQQSATFEQQQQSNGNLLLLPGNNYAAAAAMATNVVLEPVNGRHRPKPPKYNDDDDDDEEEDDDEDVDLGPETNVDAVDEAAVVGAGGNEYGKLDQAMGHDYPDEFLLNKSMKREAEEEEEGFPEDKKKRHHNEPGHRHAEADNVADSEDSEDEWNYYRPNEEGGKKSTTISGGNNHHLDNNRLEAEQEEDIEEFQVDDKPTSGDNSEAAAVTTATIDHQQLWEEQHQQQHCQTKDPALVEKTDRCNEEKEPCSPKPSEENIFDNQPISQSEPDDDVTAEFDELHHEENDELLLTKEKHQDQSELQQIDTEAEISHPEDIPLDNEAEPRQQQQLFEEGSDNSEEDEEDMESHLNPNAAEFVPTTPPMMSPQLMSQMDSDLVAGSPLKQSQRALKNRKIPSEQEFQDEICRRPSEIDDSISDFSNGEASPQKQMFGGGFDDSKMKSVIGQLNLDESEISSTKAEFGDESTSNFSVTSELYKTGVSQMDCSFSGDLDFSNSQMTTSMTPGDFKAAFERDEEEPDLNKVHELNDDDIMGSEVQNGDYKTEEKVVVDDDLVKADIELNLDDLAPQQQEREQVFSEVVEEKESGSNTDLFINTSNVSDQESHDLLSSSRMETQEKVDDVFSAKCEVPLFASNPFATEYVSTTESESVKNLAEDLQNVNFGENKERNLLDDFMQKDTHEAEVMLNPLDLNFGMASAEQKSDEPVLVSPVKDPEVMSSKFEEEILISQSTEALNLVSSNKEDEEITKANHVEDFINAVDPSSEIHAKVNESLERNLSESLQEFTGLEEQLSPKVHEVKDNIQDDVLQTLKENLADEQKDVEEVATPSPVVERKVDEAANEANLLSNEVTEVAVAATTAVAATAAAAVTAAKPAAAKSATAVSKTSKPSATPKVGAKTMSPTSPTKTGVATRTSTLAAAKKPAATSARPKPASATTTAKTTSNLTKTVAAKNVAAPRATTTTTATKTATRTSTAPTIPRTKPLSGITSKIGSLPDKKPTANGDVKPTPASRSTLASKTTAAKPSATSTASKTGLVKTSTTTTRTSTGTAAAPLPKPRPASATTTKTTTSRLSSGSVTSSTNNTAAARPKTAPTTNALSKPRVGAVGAKSPMIDKQIKETANKQISSARTLTATAKPRVSSSTTTSSTTAKRTSLAPKPATNAASPTKKPAPITKPGSKTTTTSKVNAKVTSTTKSAVIETSKIVHNGVCESTEEMKISTTTTTTNIEEDLPKKDISPIEPVTDNQLITVE